MRRKHDVRLSEGQRAVLRKLISSGQSAARELAHARILLACDEGGGDAAVAASVRVGVSTVQRVRRLFCGGGLDAALKRKPQPPRPQRRVLDGEAEARLVMLACSTPPQGRESWSMQLLADRMVELKYVDGPVSDETGRRCLKKTRPSRG